MHIVFNNLKLSKNTNSLWNNEYLTLNELTRISNNKLINYKIKLFDAINSNSIS